MPFYPTEFLERLQSEADIVNIISGYIPLKPAGRNFKALCPFHQEKTPSFMVSPEKQIYHCFGCGAGGGVISFIRDYERVDFAEAVKILAEKVGLPLPEVRLDQKLISKHKILYQINSTATEYFWRKLKSPIGKKAWSYLQQRGIDKEIIDSFKLGYATPEWEGLLRYLTQKGFDQKDIERTGLVLPRQSGGYYDRFRDRIMFPIFDLKGRPVGFGGRILGQEDKKEAKYINSPQTEIFDKSHLLYGLDRAKEEVIKTEKIIIVEGYLDLLACFRAGIRNSTATLGTALTSSHLKMLARYCRTIIMIYDSDKAGEAAALRGLDLVLEHDLAVRLVNLPPGYDPDSFLAEYGTSALVKKIEESQNLFDYKINLLRQRYNLTDVEDRAAIAAEMLPTISKVNNQVLKSGYIRKLAEVLSVTEDAVLAELNRIEKSKPDNIYFKPQVKSTLTLSPLEENLIGLMIGDFKAVLQVKESVSVDDFTHPVARLIVSKLFALIDKDEEPSYIKLLSLVDDERVERILSRILLARPQPVDEVKKQQELVECLAYFCRRKTGLELKHLKEKIKEAEFQGNQKQLTQLLKEYQNLSRGMKKS